jgi:hypothetical protein
MTPSANEKGPVPTRAQESGTEMKVNPAHLFLTDECQLPNRREELSEVDTASQSTNSDNVTI